jgi:hypothetical protein
LMFDARHVMLPDPEMRGVVLGFKLPSSFHTMFFFSFSRNKEYEKWQIPDIAGLEEYEDKIIFRSVAG